MQTWRHAVYNYSTKTSVLITITDFFNIGHRLFRRDRYMGASVCVRADRTKHQRCHNNNNKIGYKTRLHCCYLPDLLLRWSRSAQNPCSRYPLNYLSLSPPVPSASGLLFASSSYSAFHCRCRCCRHHWRSSYPYNNNNNRQYYYEY